MCGNVKQPVKVCHPCIHVYNGNGFTSLPEALPESCWAVLGKVSEFGCCMFVMHTFLASAYIPEVLQVQLANMTAKISPSLLIRAERYLTLLVKPWLMSGYTGFACAVLWEGIVSSIEQVTV